jgi:alpha-beta hydrolase superfamily lysophospholipase
MLRALPVFLYPARSSPPRAVIFFFGNDVGFWRAHQELAERLVRQGYAVAGFDVRKWMERLPDAPWQARDSAFAAGIRPIMSRAVAELAPGGAPVVVAGHSTGAEIALWTAAHAPPAGMAGVLVMSPGGRGHLRITLADLANAGDPTDAGSFDVPAQVAALPPSMRVALVRGQHDQYRYADSAFAADGGDRYRHLLVPLAGHSMKSLFVAGPVIETGLAWVLARGG